MRGSKAFLFSLECALGIVSVVLLGALAHWFQWLLPVAVLLYLLIVVPTALLCGFWQAVVVSFSAVAVQSYFTARLIRLNFRRGPGQLRRPAGVHSYCPGCQPTVCARYGACARGRILGRADARSVRVHAPDAADEPARGAGPAAWRSWSTRSLRLRPSPSSMPTCTRSTRPATGASIRRSWRRTSTTSKPPMTIRKPGIGRRVVRLGTVPDRQPGGARRNQPANQQRHRLADCHYFRSLSRICQ